MAAYLVIGNRRVKFRFFIILALLAGGILYLFSLNKSAAAYAAISYGRLDVVHSGLAVIIKDEAVYTAPAHGEAVILVSEGSKVETNEPIAVLYKENYDETVVKQLYDIQERIIEYQQEQLLDQVIDNDLMNINADIDSLVSKIQLMVKDGRYSNLGTFEIQLRSLLENKQKLLDYQTEPDSYLTELYNKEASLLLQIEKWTVRLESPKSGYISFNIDGFENILGKDSIAKLKITDVENILDNSFSGTNNLSLTANNVFEQESTKVQSEQPFFKVVDSNEEWYAVLKCESSETYMNKGDTVEVVFDDQEKTSAIVDQIIKENDHALLVLMFSSGMDKIVSKRICPLVISKTVEGLMVPERALYRNKGVDGVYVKNGDKKIFVETSIKALSNGYAIVESVSDNQQLQLHHQVLNDNE